MSTPLLQVQNIKKHFAVSDGLLGKPTEWIHAVDGVSFHINRSETLALVGESGCGKSTVGRAILRLFNLTEGQVILDGQRIDDLPAVDLHKIRRQIQVIFQDPFSSLNPRMKVHELLAEPMRNFGLAKISSEVTSRIERLIDVVRLPKDAGGRYPHEFSGGQRQRIAIARALAAEPDLLVCDEAVSALDVSVKAQIVNLLQDLQREFGLALLFISHDLAIVEHMTHRVAVMYLGQIVEIGPKAFIFGAPTHPYTRALLSAVPSVQPGFARNRIILRGDVPSPINPPSGCRFHTRCQFAFDRCIIEEPQLLQRSDGHWVACHMEQET
ncbi:MAG: ATP-binding cassette domain-containing protein [Betaproteobacteria bacterium]|nr:ATP-binding cassette domain-containing protein [Betaproteobacteria bacterium]NBY08476.1 ATP-binding cassette domain-containing protein [Betaproteobacteria bacterium]